jgi:hypothetical protein
VAGRPATAWLDALAEDFADPGLPAGWTLVDGLGDGRTFALDDPADPAACGNPDPPPPFAGRWLAVDSDCAGAGALDEELLSPPVDLSAAAAVRLDFDHWLARFGPVEAVVEARSARTAGAWSPLAAFTAASAVPEHVSLDLTSVAAGASDVEIRWRYRGPGDDLWWFLDNVAVRFRAAPDCAMTPCPGIPREVSPSLSARPLHLARDRAGLCPGGICAWFERLADADGYNFYRGDVGSWWSHQGPAGDLCAAPVVDEGTGWVRLDLVDEPGSHYYLATAFNALGEGTAGSAERDAQLSCPP